MKHGLLLASLMALLALTGCNPISADPRVGQWQLEHPVKVPGSTMKEAYVYIDISWQNFGAGTQSYVIDQTVRVPAEDELRSDAPWQQDARLITVSDSNGHYRRWWDFGQSYNMLKGKDGKICESGNSCPLVLTPDHRHLIGTIVVYDTSVKVRFTKIDPLRRE